MPDFLPDVVVLRRIEYCSDRIYVAEPSLLLFASQVEHVKESVMGAPHAAAEQARKMMKGRAMHDERDSIIWRWLLS